MLRSLLATLTLALAFTGVSLRAAATYDLVIYGGTAGAVTAAVQAKKMGKSVIIVSPDKHLGGLSAGGLGFTDTGDKSVIGGLARESFFDGGLELLAVGPPFELVCRFRFLGR